MFCKTLLKDKVPLTSKATIQQFIVFSLKKKNVSKRKKSNIGRLLKKPCAPFKNLSAYTDHKHN